MAHTEAPYWIEDPGHAWLVVPLAYVEASGYHPSKYSMIGTVDGVRVAYLEEDCDGPAYLRHCGIWDGGEPIPTLDQRYVAYFNREREHFSGEGFHDPYPRT